MAQNPQQEQWERIFKQKQRELLANSSPGALQVNNFDELSTGLHSLATSYRSTGFPSFVSRLGPSFEQVKTFTAAITSACQYEPRACLVWGAMQALVQAACENKYAVDEILELVADLNLNLPRFEAYLDILPNSGPLQIQLREMYATYLDYCIQVIKHMNRSPAANFFLYLWWSTPEQTLRVAKENIMKQAQALIITAQLVQSRQNHQQQVMHEQVQSMLQTAPLSQMPTEKEAATTEIDFPISTRKLYRNFTFLGRDKTLSAMHTFLFHAQSRANVVSQTSKQNFSPRCCIVQGLGGIGKTETALEYTYLFEEQYDAVFWVSAEQKQSLASTFSDIAEKLEMVEDLGDHDGGKQGTAIKRAEKWLRDTNRSWLIVFDNCENIDDLNAYLPQRIKGRGAVIITTQKADIFPISDPASTLEIGLTNLSRDDGGDLVFKYLKRSAIDEDEHELARQISDLVDGLPLALVTVGGYLHQAGSSVSAYYDNLKVSSLAFEADTIGPAKQANRNLRTVFDIALRELPDGARTLLNMLAFLNPDSIPEEIFSTQLGVGPLTFLKSDAELIEAIRTLKTRQLIRRDAVGTRPTLAIHRTVQWCVLLDLSKNRERRHRVFEQTLQVVRGCLPEYNPLDQPEPEKWNKFKQYVPQIFNLRTHSLWPNPPVDFTMDFAHVLSELGTYTWYAGWFKEGMDALFTADTILDKFSVDQSYSLRGDIHAHLSILASFCGVSQRTNAYEQRHKAVEARTASHNALPLKDLNRMHEIRLWNVRSDIAFGCLQWEDFELCETVIDACHAQYKIWGPVTDPTLQFEYLKFNHIISYVRMAQGRPLDAIRHAKRAAELGEMFAGLTHTMTWLCRISLANHLLLAGVVEQAEKEAGQVAAARTQLCGEFNHLTLDAQAFHAAILAKMGRHEEAGAIFAACLDRRKRSVWNDEGVARTQYLYARMLQKMGKEDEKAAALLLDARKTRNEFLTRYERWLGAASEDSDELAVFDQMCCMWAGRQTGKLKKGADQAKMIGSIDVVGDEAESDPPLEAKLGRERSADSGIADME